jgi:UPF0176 protein
MDKHGGHCRKALSRIQRVPELLNLSAYKFVPIADPQRLRESLFLRAHELRLKGTVLLAHEGLNLFLAGLEADIQTFLSTLRSDPRFADLQAKRSWSPEPPFRRLRVKVKAEIIRMNLSGVRPSQRRAPLVDALTLARWLDQGHDDAGRPLVLLDTRNAFEVDHGRFDNAIDWRISKFSDFPAALEKNAAQLAGKTVVSYCTGGIRCEKAALHMLDQGLDHVFQLDGGILKYFELAQGRHFTGECFVFDERALLDNALRPSR